MVRLLLRRRFGTLDNMAVLDANPKPNRIATDFAVLDKLLLRGARIDQDADRLPTMGTDEVVLNHMILGSRR